MWTNKKKKKSSLSKDPLDMALKKIAFRMRTEKELKIILGENLFTDEEIERTIATLKDYGYINNEEYVKSYYRGHKVKGKSDFRILNELSERGIDKEVSRQIVNQLREEETGEYKEFALTEEENALNIAIKIYDNACVNQDIRDKKQEEKLLSRIGRRLNTLGYSPSITYKVLGKIKEKLWKKET